jgi:hypothetical protein
MDLATTFVPLLQVFAAEMTTPTFQTLQTLVTGWVFAPRRTILGMVRSSGTDRHHAAFHRLFSDSPWSIDRVGLAVFDLVTVGAKTVFLAGDDTLLARTGLKVFGTGMHRDPVLSSRSHTVTRWGHCWVVLCVVLESRHVPGRTFALPVMCRLYLNKAAAAKWKRTYFKKTELMLDMLAKLERHMQRHAAGGGTGGRGKHLHFLGDSAFTAPAVLAQMPRSIAVTGRVGANVRIHEAPPTKRHPGQRGRTPKRGRRLPTPEEMLQAKGLRRAKLKVYDGSTYQVRIAEQMGRFYKAPDRDVKVVAVEHQSGGRGTEVFYTTETHDAEGQPTTAETVLTNYSRRWPIEVTFRNVKQHAGIDQPQNRTTKAARRTAPTIFLLYSLVLWWHEKVREEPAPVLRDWSNKSGPSFAEMLAALRLDSLEKTEQSHFSTPVKEPGVQKILDQLKTLMALAV